MTWAETLQQAYELFYKMLGGVWLVIQPDQESEKFWLFLFSAFAVASGVYVWQHSKTRGVSFKKLLGFILPSSIYFHKSAIVDYKFYITSRILGGFIYFETLIISAALMGGYYTSWLQHAFGPVESQLEAGLSARFSYTVILVLAVDIGLYISHYLQHKVPFFWEFHKVHHSAEVLTPITTYRFHPMDIILDGVFTGLFGGIVTGIFGYLFYNGLDEITILNTSVVMFAYNLTGHLRHSHIWLSYGWAPSHVFCSPAMHQIHHSNAERHIDKNLGLVFSIWDYLAGTLYVPREQEDLTLGLRNQEHKEYAGVWTLYVLPVKKAARLVLSGIKYAQVRLGQ
jgi:sterol desaturase/sphingolipid hydroxylase (fatty acid hydroxylase superfamily)